MIAFLVARWRLIALIGGVFAVSVALAYFNGKSDGKKLVRAEMVAALEAQKAELKQAHSRQMAALAAKNRREREAESIKDIPRPAVELCDAGDEWLHAINRAVRVSNGAAGAR